MAKDAKTISYNVEITEKGFVQVSSEVTKLNKAFSSVGESSKNMSLAIKTVVKDVRANTEAHGRTVNVMNAEISGLEQLRDSYGKSNKLYRQVQSRINAVIAEKKALTDVSSKEVKQEKTLLQQISALNDGRKRTVDVIQQEISLRRQMQSSTSTNRKEFLKEEIEIKKLERGLNSIAKSQSKVIRSSVKMGDTTKSLNKKLGNTKSATGSASGAVVELGRTISDSNYGFPAMANNVQQLATQMTFVVAEQGGVVKGFKAIGKAMTGAGGLLLLFTIGVALLERFSLESRKAKEETNKLNQAISEETSSLNILLSIAKDETLNKEVRLKAVKEINEEYPEYLSSLNLENIRTEKLNGLIEKQIKLEVARAKAKAIADEIAKENIKLLDLEASSAADNLSFTDQAVAVLQQSAIKSTGAVLEVIGKLDKANNAATQNMIERGKENQETAIQESKDRIDRLQGELIDIAKDTPSAIDALIGGDSENLKDTEDKLDSFIQRIREKAEEQKLGGDEQALLGLERDRALAEARALGAEEEGQEIQEIRRYYGDLAFELYNEQNDRFKEKREADAEERLNAELKGHRQRLKLEKQAIKAKEKVQMTAVKFANVIANLMAGIDEKSKTLKVLSFILEKGSAIASVLIQSNSSIAQQKSNTNAANAAVRLKYAGVPGGAVPMEAEIKANNLAMVKGIGQTKTSSALSIASILATSLKSSGGSTPSGGATSTTGGGETTTTQPPDFNIVGQSETNQLAQTIALSEEQPLRAYVVAEDVTTAQQLDNSIIQGASLG